MFALSTRLCVLLHVDDIFVVCNQCFLDNELLKVLKTKFEKKDRFREQKLKLVMYLHSKHFHKLLELME